MREQALDEIIAWHREIQNPGGAFDLPEGTPIVIAGDMNMYGRSIQHRQLLVGVFADTTYGDRYPIDWDGTGLADVAPYHIRGHEAYTWRNDAESFSPSKIDYIVYSDSVLELVKRYVARSRLKWHDHEPRCAGWPVPITKYHRWFPWFFHPWYVEVSRLRWPSLLANPDHASDHLPVVADFRIIDGP
jgi:exonuclease III